MMLGVEKPRGAVRNTLPEGRGRKGVWADYMWGTKIYIFKQFLTALNSVWQIFKAVTTSHQIGLLFKLSKYQDIIMFKRYYTYYSRKFRLLRVNKGLEKLRLL